MKYDKKIYIILFIILIVFFLIMFFFVGSPNITQEGYTSTIVLGDNNTVWQYRNKTWMYIKDRATLQDMSWDKFSVFDNSEYKGEYALWFDKERWYAFDDKKNAIQIDGSLLGIKSNYDLKVGNFSEKNISESVSDMEIVNQVLRVNDLSTSSQFTSIYKVDFDYDSDNIDEGFYIVSNAFPMGFDPKKIFSFAFMVDGEDIYYMYKDISTNNSFNGCKPFYEYFIDTNNDNYFEIILGCGRFSNMGQIDRLYGFSENEFKMLISNE